MPTQHPARGEHTVPRYSSQPVDSRHGVIAHLSPSDLDQARRRVRLERRFGLHHDVQDDSDRDTGAVSDSAWIIMFFDAILGHGAY